MFGLKQAYQDARLDAAHWRERYAQLWLEHTKLVDVLHRMKRDGFTIPEPEAAPPEIPDLPLAVQAAIQARAMDRRMAQELEQWARVRLASGETDTQVEQALWEGDTA
jgi:hypothetical protein